MVQSIKSSPAPTPNLCFAWIIPKFYQTLKILNSQVLFTAPTVTDLPLNVSIDHKMIIPYYDFNPQSYKPKLTQKNPNL